MPTVAPVKNVTMRPPHEGSRFRPKNDSDDIRQAHKLAGKQREQNVDYQAAVNQLARKVETLRRRMLCGGQSAQSQSNGQQMFIIKTLFNADYFVANTWDGSTRGAGDVYIAKHPQLRPSVTDSQVDGDSLTFSGYSGDNLRVADNGTTTENQVVRPPYIDLPNGTPAAGNVDAIITATPMHTGLLDDLSNPILWIETTPRVWAKQYTP